VYVLYRVYVLFHNNSESRVQVILGTESGVGVPQKNKDSASLSIDSNNWNGVDDAVMQTLSPS